MVSELHYSDMSTRCEVGINNRRKNKKKKITK
jgi:hypothetical protein